METLGSLVDKLSIVNLKLWFVTDWVHKSQAETPEQFARQTPEQIHAKVIDLAALNQYRNRLMNEIDTLLNDALKTGSAPTEEKIKLLRMGAADPNYQLDKIGT